MCTLCSLHTAAIKNFANSALCTEVQLTTLGLLLIQVPQVAIAWMTLTAVLASSAVH